jgi:hypothetical protein
MKPNNSFENPSPNDFAGMMPKGKKFKTMIRQAEEFTEKEMKRKDGVQQARAEQSKKRNQEQIMRDGQTFDKSSMSRGAGIKKIGAGGRTQIGTN